MRYNVPLNGIFRSMLITRDLKGQYPVDAWPDAVLNTSTWTAEVSGLDPAFAGARTITRSVVSGQTGKHIITVNCAGLVAGTVVELNGAYYIDSERYAWYAEIYVDASPAIQDSIDSDQQPVEISGEWFIRTTKRGTGTLVIPDKNLIQPNGDNVTDIESQFVAGFKQEPV